MDANSTYSNSGNSFVFDQAIRINDNFAIGVKTLDDVNTESDVAGELPATVQYSADFKNWSSGNVSVDNSGKFSYTYLGTTYTSTGTVWNDFLSQKMVLPTKAIATSRNSFNINETVIINGGAKYKDLLFGINLIPIKASAGFDNCVQSVVNKTASDMTFYTPNFDATNPVDIGNWTSDPSRYGAAGGYKTDTISVPEGEIVADSRWSGNYSGSAMRMDLGMDWPVSDFFNLSLMSENINGATLVMRGTGLSYYANHRFNTTSNPDIDPINGINWTPFNSGATDFVFPAGQGLYLESEKTYIIPKRTKLGFALKKPILITVDYEITSTPIQILMTGSDGVQKIANISGMNVLRLGGETQLFRLPLWLRGGFGFLFKPSSDNAEVQSKIDSTFKIGSRSIPVMPVKLDLGLQTEIKGVKTGLALGIDGLSLINLYSVDLVYNNIGKALFYTLYAKNNSWQFAYTASADPIATVSDVQQNRGTLSGMQLSDVKWSQAISISYLF